MCPSGPSRIMHMDPVNVPMRPLCHRLAERVHEHITFLLWNSPSSRGKMRQSPSANKRLSSTPAVPHSVSRGEAMTAKLAKLGKIEFVESLNLSQVNVPG